MQRLCLALDLKDDPVLIEEYKRHHRNVWPEIKQSILAAGVVQMEIYLVGARLFMVIDAEDNFSLENKAGMDASNEKVQEWERLMSNYQQTLPQAREGEKWVEMERVFVLREP